MPNHFTFFIENGRIEDTADFPMKTGLVELSKILKGKAEFLKRDNYMSQLMKRHPDFSANLSGSYGTEVRQLQKRKAKDA